MVICLGRCADLHVAQLMTLPLAISCSSKSRLVFTFLIPAHQEGARPRGRPKKTWREIVEKDCQACKLNKEDAMNRKRWRKQVRDD